MSDLYPLFQLAECCEDLFITSAVSEVVTNSYIYEQIHVYSGFLGAKLDKGKTFKKVNLS